MKCKSPINPVKLINYIWWLIFLQNPNKICWAVSQKLHPQCVPILQHVQIQQSLNCCKFCQIRMTGQYDQLHTVANNLTKFEQNLSSCIQGVMSTSLTGQGTDTDISMCLFAYKRDKKKNHYLFSWFFPYNESALPLANTEISMFRKYKKHLLKLKCFKSIWKLHNSLVGCVPSIKTVSLLLIHVLHWNCRWKWNKFRHLTELCLNTLFYKSV